MIENHENVWGKEVLRTIPVQLNYLQGQIDRHFLSTRIQNAHTYQVIDQHKSAGVGFAIASAGWHRLHRACTSCRYNGNQLATLIFVSRFCLQIDKRSYSPVCYQNKEGLINLPATTYYPDADADNKTLQSLKVTSNFVL